MTESEGLSLGAGAVVDSLTGITGLDAIAFAVVALAGFAFHRHLLKHKRS